MKDKVFQMRMSKKEFECLEEIANKYNCKKSSVLKSLLLFTKCYGLSEVKEYDQDGQIAKKFLEIWLND